MNYNQLNQTYDYWRKEIAPHLVNHFNVINFEEYLKRFAYTPHGRWIRDGIMVKISRIGFAIDPEKFLAKYKSQCITYNSPIKAEDGVQRIIYQISPTLHIELALWIWIEHEVVQSYGSVFVCYNNHDEYLKFLDELYKLRRTGNTEDKPTQAGFSGMFNSKET